FEQFLYPNSSRYGNIFSSQMNPFHPDFIQNQFHLLNQRHYFYLMKNLLIRLISDNNPGKEPCDINQTQSWLKKTAPFINSPFWSRHAWVSVFHYLSSSSFHSFPISVFKNFVMSQVGWIIRIRY